jgi:hypothetical protein
MQQSIGIDPKKSLQILWFRFGPVLGFTLFLLVMPAQAQTKGDISNKPPDIPPPSAPINVSTDPLSSLGAGRSSRGIGSSMVTLKSTMTEMRENAQLLRIIDQELQDAVASSSAVDYDKVIIDASDMTKLAIRLMRNLALSRIEAKPLTGADQAPAVASIELRASIAALDSTVQTFLNDSMLTQPKTVEADQLTTVAANLESMARIADLVRREAEVLSASQKGAKKSSSHAKSRLKPGSTIELTAECSVWTVADLLERPSQARGRESVNVGIEAHSRRHVFAEEVVLPIDDCVDGATYERGLAEKLNYVAIVRDIVSYEVKDRVFAYRVPYTIGFSKNGKIVHRLAQLVYFIYVDEAGDGTFELLKGPAAFGLVPDWAKDLAQKRERFTSPNP